MRPCPACRRVMASISGVYCPSMAPIPGWIPPRHLLARCRLEIELLTACARQVGLVVCRCLACPHRSLGTGSSGGPRARFQHEPQPPKDSDWIQRELALIAEGNSPVDGAGRLALRGAISWRPQ